MSRIDGIVVAEENREVVMEGWRQEEQMMIEKEMKVCILILYSWKHSRLKMFAVLPPSAYECLCIKGRAGGTQFSHKPTSSRIITSIFICESFRLPVYGVLILAL